MKKAFLYLSVIAIGLVMLNSCESVQDKKQIGIQLYSLKDLMKEKPVETIKAVGEMGYKMVETANYRSGKFYGMDAVEFQNVCKESGLYFVGSHATQHLPDSGSWDDLLLWWDTCIDAHVKAGAEYIVAPGMGGLAYESLDGLSQYCKYFNMVGEKCNKAGIRFGYHNHSKEFNELEGEVMYDYMLNNTDPEKVMFEMDLYWAVEGGVNPLDYFEKYPGRFWLWHVKDVGVLGASGKMDFESIWTGKEKAGVKYYIVEQEKHDLDPLEGVKLSLDYLLNAKFVK